MTASDRTPPGHRPQSARRAGVAGLLGTMIEAYDFVVYTYLVVFTAPLFFPSENPTTGVLASLLALGAGFAARPLGGLFFGRLGDRRGRRFALVATVTTMGSATFLIGLLPTYGTIGILAPILLVVLRLAQGFSAGGELMGSATFVTEHGTTRNHGLLSSITPVGNGLGAALAPGVVGLLTVFVAADLMSSWGWRIPLLLSLPLTVLCLVLRTRLDDSPEFHEVAEREDVTRRSPLREVLRNHPGALFQVFAISATVLLIGYITTAFFPLYLQSAAGMTPGGAAGISSVATLCAVPCLLAAGFLVDRIGRLRMLVTMLLVNAVLVFPVMYVIGRSEGMSLPLALVYIVFMCTAGAVAVPGFSLFTAAFPTRVRYTGAAVGYGLGSVAGAGFGPYLAALTSELSGSQYAPAMLIIGVAAFGLVVTWVAHRVGSTGPIAAKPLSRNEAA